MDMTTESRYRYLRWVYLLHILIAAPTLIAVGVMGSTPKGTSYLLKNRWLFSLLLLLGVGALGYHGYWYFKYLKQHKYSDYKM